MQVASAIITDQYLSTRPDDLEKDRGLLDQRLFFVDEAGSLGFPEREVDTLRQAIAVAHRLLFSQRSLRILNFALGRPHGSMTDLLHRPERDVMPPDFRPCPIIAERLNEFAERDNMHVIVDCNMDDDGAVRPWDPRWLRINRALIHRTWLARESSPWVFQAHLFHLAIVIGHEAVHSIRDTIFGVPRPTPPKLRGLRDKGRTRSVPNSIGSLVSGRTGEGGWHWETEFFGGYVERILMRPTHSERRYEGQIERLVLATVDHLGECYSGILPSEVKLIVEGTYWPAVSLTSQVSQAGKIAYPCSVHDFGSTEVGTRIKLAAEVEVAKAEQRKQRRGRM